MNKALKTVRPTLTTRSLRRGALQDMATGAMMGGKKVDIETLMSITSCLKRETNTTKTLF